MRPDCSPRPGKARQGFAEGLGAEPAEVERLIATVLDLDHLPDARALAAAFPRSRRSQAGQQRAIA